MKRIGILLLLAPIVASIALWGQKAVSHENGPAGSQVVAAMAGGSVWTGATTGTCVLYFPILGDLDVAALFAPGSTGAPQIDKEHSYLIWVSDWSIRAMFDNPGFGGTTVNLALVPPGKIAIYYSDNPASRDWSDVTKRSTWGVPVATLNLGGGMFQSPDGFKTDRFYFSAEVVRSKDVNLGGRAFNFRDLVPHGMTCLENGLNGSSTESATCIAMGD